MRSGFVIRCVTHAALLLVLAGCSLEREFLLHDSAQGVKPDETAQLLIDAANRAEIALRTFATLKSQLIETREIKERTAIVPPELALMRDIDWIGPVETLAATLADDAGYAFLASGRPPVRPVIVSLVADDARILDVLRDAGFQAGADALLIVDATQREVRLAWGPFPSSTDGAVQR